METSVVISGRPLKVIIDTRAGASIISMPLVKTLGHAMDKKNRINVQTVDWAEHRSLGTCRDVEIKIGDEVYKEDLVVQRRDDALLLLGMTFLAQNDARIHPLTGKITLGLKGNNEANS
jgi:predicted aspartyl protease